MIDLRTLPRWAVLLLFASSIQTAARESAEPDAGAASDPLVVACTAVTDPGAEAACQRAIDSGTWQGAEAAWAWNNLGLARAAAKRFPAAIEAYSQAIALDPGFAPAWSNRGNAHAALNDLLPAFEDHDKAVALDPAYVAARHNRGVDYEELGRYKEALADYRAVIEMAPSHRGAHVGIATANCKRGRVKASAEAHLVAINRGVITAVEMQERLRDDGFYKGAIDGIFGRGSRAALRAWTRKGCLPPA